MLPYTEMWIVDRRTLDPTKDKVEAKKVAGNIPFECIHFSTEYEDAEDVLTIYTIHNNAACFAEWIRSYDTNYFTGKPYPDHLIGDFATGEMALGAVGKFKIDGKTATLVDQTICRSAGEHLLASQGKSKNIGANTWGIGLYAHKLLASAQAPSKKINNLYFINFGANPDYLTKWIYDLYKDYQNRDMSLSDFIKYTQEGIPSSIVAVNTRDMSFSGYLQLEVDMHPTSIQFVPKRNATDDEDGYLLVMIKVPGANPDDQKYDSQLWILDPKNLSQGPVCVLGNDDFNFCFTVHSAWLPNGESVKSGYRLDIKKDYEEVIEKSIFFERARYTQFFQKYVFPHFE
jgi:hypothetical protein